MISDIWTIHLDFYLRRVLQIVDSRETNTFCRTPRDFCVQLFIRESLPSNPCHPRGSKTLSSQVGSLKALSYSCEKQSEVNVTDPLQHRIENNAYILPSDLKTSTFPNMFSNNSSPEQKLLMRSHAGRRRHGTENIRSETPCLCRIKERGSGLSPWCVVTYVTHIYCIKCTCYMI